MPKKIDLTVRFFGTGAMAAPNKSGNPTVLGQGGPTSTQWSHPGNLLVFDHKVLSGTP